MIIQCPECQTRFRMADEKMKPGGTKVRCSRCRHIFLATGEPPATQPPPATEESVDFGDFNMKSLGDGEGGAAPIQGRIAEEEVPVSFRGDSSAIRGEVVEEFTSPVARVEEEAGTAAGAISFEEKRFGSPTPDAEDSEAAEGPSAFAEAGQFSFEEEKSADGSTEFSFDEEEAREPLAGFGGEEETGATGFVFAEETNTEGFSFGRDGNGGAPEFSFGEEENEEKDSEFSFGEDPPADAAAEFSFEEESDGGPGEFSFDVEDAEKSPGGGDFSFDEPFAEEDSLSRKAEADLPFDEEENRLDFSRMTFGDPPSAEPPPAAPFPVSTVAVDRPSIAERPKEFAPDEFPGPEASPPFSAPPPRKSPFSRVLNLVLLLLLVLAGAVGYFFYQGGAPDLSQLFGRLTGTSAQASASGQVRLTNLSGTFVQNREAGQFFVIRGVAVNEYKESRSSIAVKGVLYSQQGQPLLQQTVFSGNSLDEEALRTLSYAKIEERMNNQFGDSLSNLNVSPGKAIPFVIVFKNLPPGLAEFTVEVADSKPGSG